VVGFYTASAKAWQVYYEELRSPWWRRLFHPDPAPPPQCDAGEQAVLTAAFAKVATLLGDLRDQGGDCVALADCLATKTLANVTVECPRTRTPCNGHDWHSNPQTNSVFVCRRYAPGGGGDPNTLLLHELIHLCGGTNVDAYPLSNYLTWGTAHNGSIPPSNPDVLQAMCDDPAATRPQSGLVAGTFVIWTPASGEVFVKDTDTLLTTGEQTRPGRYQAARERLRIARRIGY
jgi:hypothetical protein